MGMYTEIYLTVELSKDIPRYVIDWINDDSEDESIPSRVRCFGYSSSYYFDGIGFKRFYYDDISKSYYLTTRFDIKNYNDEIEFLLDKLSPYILSDGHIGHIRYEESEYPTILMFDSETKEIKYKEI
jgi:hypothetical protein